MKLNLTRMSLILKSYNQAGQLEGASSSSASSRFGHCTRLRRSGYGVRVTVPPRRGSASGTKLRMSSLATSRFTRRSASAKSFLRPRRARFDCACARGRVPDVGGPLVSNTAPSIP